MDKSEEPDEWIYGALLKEEAHLGYCDGSCEQTSPHVIELISGKSEEELLEIATKLLPVPRNCDRPDEEAQLFVVTTELTDELRRRFKERVAKEIAAKKEKEAAQRAADAQRNKEANVARLKAEIAALQSGEELARKKAMLAAVEEGS